MKKNIFYIGILLAIVIFSACEKNEPVLLSKKVVFFEKQSAAVAENSADPLEINLMVAAPEGSGGTDVSISFSTEGLDNPAVEGTDFTVSGTTASFDKYFGTQTITITPTDNDVYETDKYVYMILSSATNGYELGSEDTLMLTITDNEHPLAVVIGSYSATGVSYFNGDEAWSITTAPDADDVTKLWITGFVNAGQNLDIYGIVDVKAGTIQIPVGQDIYEDDTNPAELAGFYGPDGSDAIPEGGFITINFDADGNMTVADEYGSKITAGANQGYWFNVYKAGNVFTKAAKATK